MWLEQCGIIGGDVKWPDSLGSQCSGMLIFLKYVQNHWKIHNAHTGSTVSSTGVGITQKTNLWHSQRCLSEEEDSLWMCSTNLWAGVPQWTRIGTRVGHEHPSLSASPDCGYSNQPALCCVAKPFLTWRTNYTFKPRTKIKPSLNCFWQVLCQSSEKGLIHLSFLHCPVKIKGGSNQSIAHEQN